MAAWRQCVYGNRDVYKRQDAGSDENVAAFANRTNDDAVLEKTDSEENGEKEDTAVSYTHLVWKGKI